MLERCLVLEKVDTDEKLDRLSRVYEEDLRMKLPISCFIDQTYPIEELPIWGDFGGGVEIIDTEDECELCSEVAVVIVEDEEVVIRKMHIFKRRTDSSVGFLPV